LQLGAGELARGLVSGVSTMPRSRHAAIALTLLLTGCVAAACHEEGEIKVASLKFEGVKQVNRTALANALKTKQVSRLW